MLLALIRWIIVSTYLLAARFELRAHILGAHPKVRVARIRLKFLHHHFFYVFIFLREILLPPSLEGGLDLESQSLKFLFVFVF